MFKSLINAVKQQTSNDDNDTRRDHQRHSGGQCVCIIDDVTYPVSNWSKGGLLLMGDDRLFGVSDLKGITLRFRLTNGAIDIAHKGHILRKGRDKFVLQFAPLTQNIERQFNSVLNDFVTKEFMQSQT